MIWEGECVVCLERTDNENVKDWEYKPRLGEVGMLTRHGKDFSQVTFFNGRGEEDSVVWPTNRLEEAGENNSLHCRVKRLEGIISNMQSGRCFND